jgi:hypothetical protein
VAEELVIAPFVTSSASKTGTKSEPFGFGPAPESPGTVERRVFARIPQNNGLLKV